MTETGVTMTADELMHLPDQGRGYELIAGELHEMPPAGGEEESVVGTSAARLSAYLDRHPDLHGDLFAAGTGFLLSRNPDVVRAPDIAFVSGDRLPMARAPSFPQLAPDLVVEVVSPNDNASEVHEKIHQWL